MAPVSWWRGLKPRAREGRPRPGIGAHWELQVALRIVARNRALRKALRGGCEGIRRAVALVRAAASTRLLEIDDHAKIAGFCLSVRNVEALRRQTPPQQFANRRCAAGHVTAEPPLIEGGKLL